MEPGLISTKNLKCLTQKIMLLPTPHPLESQSSDLIQQEPQRASLWPGTSWHKELTDP